MVTPGAGAITMNGASNLAISTGQRSLVIADAVTVTASGAGPGGGAQLTAGSLAVGGFNFQASSAAVSQTREC